LLPPVSPTGKGAAAAAPRNKQKGKTMTTLDNEQIGTPSLDIITEIFARMRRNQELCDFKKMRKNYMLQSDVERMIKNQTDSSEKLITLYARSDDATRKLINRVLIFVCGDLMFSLIADAQRKTGQQIPTVLACLESRRKHPKKARKV
jgi:hypothetical protein